MLQTRLKQFVVSLLLMFLYAGVTTAQNLNFGVRSFNLDPFDMTASNPKHEKVDGSGDRYAIIKVRPIDSHQSVKGFRFDFHHLRSTIDENHEGEIWVYVQRNAKMVTIGKDGYKTLNNYDLGQTVQAGKTYVMEIFMEATAKVLIEHELNMQFVQFQVNPANTQATVLYKKVGGTQAGFELLGTVDNTGSLTKNLPFGVYEYQVAAPNYHTSEGRIQLGTSEKTHIENVTLKPNFSTMTLTVENNAEIYINEEFKGNGRWVGDLKAGEYVVECRLKNHRNSSQRLYVEANDNRTVKLTSPTPITGFISASSTPSGAVIEVDGKPSGVTPRNIKGILIGKHTVRISKENYTSVTREIEVKEGETVNLNVTLDNMSKFTVSSNPSGATLYIDGVLKGRTPRLLEMKSGYYNLELRSVGNKYHTLRKRVHIDGSKSRYDYKLARLRQRPNSLYMQVGYQAGKLEALTGTVGGYIGNFNIEAHYMMGTSDSETIYWNYGYESWNDEYRTYTLDEIYHSVYIGGRVGYGILLGAKWRLTPQLGCGIVKINSDETGCYVFPASLGGRLDYAINSWLGINITPEFCFPVSKSNVYEQLIKVSSIIKGWGTGFNIRGGLYVYF